MNVDFDFPNELYPPTNIFGYFYNANNDTYILTTIGQGNSGFSIGYGFDSTKDTSNQAQNDFFGAFNDYFININIYLIYINSFIVHSCNVFFHRVFQRGHLPFSNLLVRRVDRLL